MLSRIFLVSHTVCDEARKSASCKELKLDVRDSVESASDVAGVEIGRF